MWWDLYTEPLKDATRPGAAGYFERIEFQSQGTEENLSDVNIR
jgi:hypothetical protein